MKKNWLVVSLLLVSCNFLSAAQKDFRLGRGWYIVQQGGVGLLNLSGDGSFYAVSPNGVLTDVSLQGGSLSSRLSGSLVDGASRGEALIETSFDSSSSKFFPSIGMQLNWGYLHRFKNDVTLGAEFTVLSPALRLGYMLNNRHHISCAVHYAAITRLGFDAAVSYLERNLPDDKKDIFHLELKGLSCLGGSAMYEYFTSRGNFFRMQVRADYYELEGKVGSVTKLESKLLPFVVDGKGVIWDVTAYFGVGTQW